jgi:hypothetical protein
MYNSDHGAISSPFFLNNERCIFCLNHFSEEANFVAYDGPVFEINKAYYKLNCFCNPSCHKSCIRLWLIKNIGCPVCSEEITHIEAPKQKLCYKQQIINACFYFFVLILFGSVVSLGVMIYLYVKKGA